MDTFLQRTHCDYAGPRHLRVVRSAHGVGQSTVTMEWTPPTSGRAVTIGVSPPPLCGPMPVTTSSTHTTITLMHNINYTVTVTLNTMCAGDQQDTATIRIG